MLPNIHDKGVSIMNAPQELLKQYVQSQHFTSTADIMAAMNLKKFANWKWKDTHSSLISYIISIIIPQYAVNPCFASSKTGVHCILRDNKDRKDGMIYIRLNLNCRTKPG